MNEAKSFLCQMIHCSSTLGKGCTYFKTRCSSGIPLPAILVWISCPKQVTDKVMVKGSEISFAALAHCWDSNDSAEQRDGCSAEPVKPDLVLRLRDVKLVWLKNLFIGLE